MVKQNKVDGIIGITYSDIDQYISSSLPFVSIDRHFTEDVIYVTADNAEGGRLAARELAKRGAEHIAYIGGHQDTPNETKNRRKYFELEAQELGIEYEILDLLEPIANLQEEAKVFLQKHPAIDGIFTITDMAALDVIRALGELGRKVPQDVQVVGFDGLRMTLESNFLVSTIAQPVEEMARVAVTLLLDVVEGKEVEPRTVLPVSFQEGSTTKRR